MSESRVPPHSYEMERAALCSALIEDTGFPRIAPLLTPEDFYDHRHQLVYTAMQRMAEAGAPISLLTVCEHMEAAGDLKAAGGPAYVAAVTGEMSTSSHAEYYARKVREKAVLRRLILLGQSLAAEAFEAPDPGELAARTLSELASLRAGGRRTEPRWLRDLLPEMYARIDSSAARSDEGLTSGIPALDALTGPLKPRHFVVIGARPMVGKSSLLLQLILRAAALGPALLFTLEMSAEEVVLRAVSQRAKVDSRRMEAGVMSEAEEAQVARAIGDLARLPLLIGDGRRGLADIREQARLVREREGGLVAVAVDYVGLMLPPPARSREQEVAALTGGLKGLAGEMECVVLAASQLNREVEKRSDKRPVLADFRDSGATEQDADKVIMLYREAVYEDEAGNATELLVRKNRNGPTGMAPAVFLGEWTLFAAAERHEADAARAAVSPQYKDDGDGDEPLPF